MFYSPILKKTEEKISQIPWAWWLLAVLALGAALRFPGLLHGLPKYPDADEPAMIALGVQIFKGDLNPHFFNYPSLYLYFLAFLVGGVNLTYHGLGLVGLTAHTQTPYWLFFASARGMNVVFSLAAVAIVFMLGRRLWGRRAGLLSALFLAVAPIHVDYAMWIKPDMLSMTLALGSIYASLAYYDDPGGSKRKLYAAAALAGLALGAKYMFLIVLAPTGSLLLKRGESGLRVRLVHLAGVGAVAAGVFLLTTPFAALSFREFFGDVLFEQRHYSSGHPGAYASIALTVFVRYLFAHGLTPTVAVCSLLGIVLMTRRDYRRSAITLAVPVLWLLFAGRYKVAFVHNIVIFSAAASLGAGYLLSRLKPGVWLALAVAIHPIVLDISSAIERSKLDIRYVAAEWINANLPEESAIAREEYTPFFDDNKFTGRYIGICGLSYVSPDSVRRAGYDYVLCASHDRFEKEADVYPSEAEMYRRHLQEFETLRVFEPGKRYRGKAITVLKVSRSKSDGTDPGEAARGSGEE